MGNEGIQDVGKVIGAEKLTFHGKPVLLENGSPNPEVASGVASALWRSFDWSLISKQEEKFGAATERLAQLCSTETLAALALVLNNEAERIGRLPNPGYLERRTAEHIVAFQQRFGPQVRQVSLAANAAAPLQVEGINVEGMGSTSRCLLKIGRSGGF